MEKERICPYIGTIKRDMLDFDFEKVCPISLTNLNVYACLVCGKYYQGRGLDTYAYIHSLEEDHHMFINLSDQRIYCLPDGYEVHDKSLNDIKFNLKPKIELSEIDKYNSSRALDGTEYIPGCIGLNNIKKTDYANVIIQGLCRVPELRNFLISYDDEKTDLVYFINLEI
jgi:U4/U6.U5 tri-snRNP-associated protein 2